MHRDRPILVASNLSKSFGSTHALVDAKLEVYEGEMRALAGANGSGKSTLVKILSGYHEPEAGARLAIGRVDVRLPMHPSDFAKYGVACVHQDLGLLPGLSVADNIMSYEIASARYFVHPKRLGEIARGFLEFVEVSLPLDAPIESLSRSDRALLALARALGTLESFATRQGRKGILVLDEITAFLPRHEVQALHNGIRRVREFGHAVVFVSHDLDEVLDTADTVTVLRNGRIVVTAKAVEMTHDLLVRSIVGEAGGQEAGAQGSQERGDRDSRTAVRVDHLSGTGVRDVALTVNEGEILGVTGLMGSGFEEIPYMLFGAYESRSGQMLIGEDIVVSLPELSPDGAMACGIGLVPGDRLRHGLFMDLEVAENLCSLLLDKMRRLRYLLSWRTMRQVGRAAIADYGIVSRGERSLPRELSGGNQQKVLLARWLMLHGRHLLLLHEPVQGVDVRARAAIVDLLRERASQGTPILCASSDYQALIELCDRAVIFKKGEVASVLTRDRETGVIDKERLTELCIGDTDSGPEVRKCAGRPE